MDASRSSSCPSWETCEIQQMLLWLLGPEKRWNRKNICHKPIFVMQMVKWETSEGVQRWYISFRCFIGKWFLMAKSTKTADGIRSFTSHRLETKTLENTCDEKTMTKTKTLSLSSTETRNNDPAFIGWVRQFIETIHINHTYCINRAKDSHSECSNKVVQAVRHLESGKTQHLEYTIWNLLSIWRKLKNLSFYGPNPTKTVSLRISVSFDCICDFSYLETVGRCM